MVGSEGMFIVGHLNENEERLLSFCAMNEVYIMNTIFAKKRIHQHTWQHIGMRIWHCIGYVLMHHPQQPYCTDAMVFHSAECWTDHSLVFCYREASSTFQETDIMHLDRGYLMLAICIMESSCRNLCTM